MNPPRIIILTLSALFVVSSVSAQLVKSCDQKLLKPPQSYEENSELYYLAWMEHGRPGQRAVASQLLLDMDEKKEYDAIQKLWSCESNKVIKNSLQLALYDQRPDDHLAEVEQLFEGKTPYGGSIELEALGKETPEPYKTYLDEPGSTKLFFSWRQNSALRLLREGHLSDELFKELLTIASSIEYYRDREEAKKIFNLFEGIPEFSVEPRVNLPGGNALVLLMLRKQTDEYTQLEWRREKQLRAIRKWYNSKKATLRWKKDSRKYVVS